MKKQGKWQEKVTSFMRNRYGRNDILNKHIIFFSFVSIIIYPLTNKVFGLILSILLLAYSYFRIFSKNIAARKKENETYMRWLSPIRFQIEKIKNRKKYRYLKCPKCQQKIRVPKNKGMIRVTCPKCQQIEEIKS